MGILLATEGSVFDRGAERAAITLAHRTGTTLTAVRPMASNVVAEAECPIHVDNLENAVAADVRALRASAEALGVVLDVEVPRTDDPAAAIVGAVETLEPELLVIRRLGRRGFLRRLLLGEMVADVLSRIDVPVLVVPGGVATLGTRIALLPSESGWQPAASRRVGTLFGAADGGLVDLTLTQAGTETTASVLRHATAAGADAIAVARGSQRIDPGMRRLLEIAECPVLVVPPGLGVRRGERSPATEILHRPLAAPEADASAVAGLH